MRQKVATLDRNAAVSTYLTLNQDFNSSSAKVLKI